MAIPLEMWSFTIQLKPPVQSLSMWAALLAAVMAVIPNFTTHQVLIMLYLRIMAALMTMLQKKVLQMKVLQKTTATTLMIILRVQTVAMWHLMLMLQVVMAYFTTMLRKARVPMVA